MQTSNSHSLLLRNVNGDKKSFMIILIVADQQFKHNFNYNHILTIDSLVPLISEAIIILFSSRRNAWTLNSIAAYLRQIQK